MTDPFRAALVAALQASAGTPGANYVVRGESLAQAEVRGFAVTTELGAQIAVDVQSAAEALAGREFLAYDPAYQTSRAQVLVEVIEAIPELAAIDRRVRDDDVPGDVGDSGGPVVVMAHALGVGADRVVGYRTGGAGIATRRRHGLPLIPRGDVYRPVGGDLLYYEPRFDVITCAGNAYFTNASLIQTRLHAPDKARALARATLQRVTDSVRIDGYPELEKAVMDDPTLRAKMMSVARLMERDPEYAELLTTQRLVAFVEANPQYQIPVGEVDGEKVLRFEAAAQHRHQIPRLLADDYLYSRLTQRSYEAGSKQRVEGS